MQSTFLFREFLMVVKCREKMRLDDKLLNLESLFRELLENSFYVNYLNY